MMRKVLVIDDEQSLRKVLAATLRREGYEVAVAENGEEGLARLSELTPDVVVTDLVMPKVGGFEVLKAVRERSPEVQVVVITAHGSEALGDELKKMGAFDYVTKPFEHAELKRIVESASKTRDHYRVHMVADDKWQRTLVGSSPAVQEVFKIIEKVADTPSTVLVTGESGTGKELVATALHEASSRKSKPLIKINCGAIPNNLVESELFGYERGAFTGAVGSKPGRFELADGGTLFLDEIGEVPLEMQVKLLRALQYGELERVGGLKTLKVDVRLIAATNRDLKAEIAAGRFREDLYYRLAVVPIALPSLRERQSDIPLLAQHFIEKYNKRLNKRIEGLEPDAMAALQAYPFPGNIRELENLVERALLFADGPRIRLLDLPENVTGVKPGVDEREKAEHPALAASPPADASMKDIVKHAAAELERGLIAKALEETGGNVTQAAKKLKISRKSLQIKMKELGLRDVDPD